MEGKKHERKKKGREKIACIEAKGNPISRELEKEEKSSIFKSSMMILSVMVMVFRSDDGIVKRRAQHQTARSIRPLHHLRSLPHLMVIRQELQSPLTGIILQDIIFRRNWGLLRRDTDGILKPSCPSASVFLAA